MPTPRKSSRMNDKAKVHLLAQSALSNFEWTVKELGVEYNLEAIGQEGECLV